MLCCLLLLRALGQLRTETVNMLTSFSPIPYAMLVLSANFHTVLTVASHFPPLLGFFTVLCLLLLLDT